MSELHVICKKLMRLSLIASSRSTSLCLRYGWHTHTHLIVYRGVERGGLGFAVPGLVGEVAGRAMRLERTKLDAVGGDGKGFCWKQGLGLG